MRARATSFLLAIGLTLPGVGDAAPYRIGPVPVWVKPVAAEPPHASGPSRGNVAFRLIDVQVNRALAAPEMYYHSVKQARNGQGVPEIARVSVEFDPSYQTLVLHAVTIHRGGESIAVPLAGKVRLLQREARLEEQIYDGTLTANLILEDVRSGDTVESAYTIRGANPVLGGSYSARWLIASDEPLDVLHRRLVWPADRPLRILRRCEGAAPTVTQRGNLKEYELLRRDTPALVVEGGVPAWYEPFPAFAIEDGTTWSDVARWGGTMFAEPAVLSPAMRAKVAELAGGVPGDDARALAVTRFVQDQVRYLGIEIGQNSHRATDPNTVLARRFGDCKDKALLLVTMLHALGMKAEPALVSSSLTDSVGRNGPSRQAFDHVIVRLELQGKTYWIDATREAQGGGGLASLAVPRFGRALVLAEGTTDLAVIPVPKEQLPLSTIEKSVKVDPAGGTATYEVKTSYFGLLADQIRGFIRSSSRDDIARGYLDYYQERYPNIEATAPPDVHDDREANRVVIAEHYRIPEFGKQREDTESKSDFNLYEVANAVPAWRGVKRASPLSLGVPHRTIFLAHMEGPTKFRIKPESKEIRVPGMKFVYRESSTGEKIEEYAEIENSRSFLTAEEAVAAAPKFKEMASSLVVGLEGQPEAAPPGGSLDLVSFSITFMIALAALALSIVVAVMIWRAPPPATLWPRLTYKPGNEAWIPDQPIGGWLYLFGLGIVLLPMFSLYQIGGTVPSAFKLAIGFGMGGRVAALHLFVLLMLFASIAEFVGSILLVALFLQRKRKFFRVYVGFMVLLVASTAIWIAVALILMPEEAKPAADLVGALIKGLVSFTIWALYFTNSRRAEATFVR